jgi:hypothetical protein
MTLPGPMLQRGFWLDVWQVETPEGEMLDVGRTGDDSSPHATAPHTRIGQHLGFAKTQNTLRRQLASRGVEPEDWAAVSCADREAQAVLVHRRPARRLSHQRRRSLGAGFART